MPVSDSGSLNLDPYSTTPAAEPTELDLDPHNTSPATIT
jgi:hypothetical protein